MVVSAIQTSLGGFLAGFPKTVYYPSLVVNLQIRFDEGLTKLNPKTVDDTAKEADVPTLPPEPVIFAPTTKDNLSQVIGIVPKSASIEIANYRQAGTFQLTMEYRDLPLDPRTIRALGVSIHLGAVPAGDWAGGMLQFPAGAGQKGQSSRRTSILEAKEENALIVGTADSIDVEHSANGSTIRIEGRDLRGILLDAAFSNDALQGVDLNRRIDQVVRDILALHPLTKGIVVEDLDPIDWIGEDPRPRVKKEQPRVNLDAVGSEQVNPVQGTVDKNNFWDVITNCCFLVGAIPYFHGSKLRIRRARNLFDTKHQEATQDPFMSTPFANEAPREIDGTRARKPEKFTYRRLVFGQDIESLKFERKLGGVKVPVIKCVSIDTDAKGKHLLIEAQAPTEQEIAARTTNVGPGGQVAQTEVHTIPVAGIKDKDKLYRIAVDLHEEIGRQEMGGSVHTKNLSSFGGSNQDPDLLTLRPGDPIEFRVDASWLGVYPPPISELTGAAGRSYEEQVKVVKEKLGDENLARILVGINRGEIVQLQNTFRTSNVRYDWDSETGVALSFDFQNYIEMRYTPDGMKT